MRFYYTSIPREHDAGIMFLGHGVNPVMIIPPGAPNYTIGSICTADCTRNVCKINCLYYNTVRYVHMYHSTSQMVASASLPMLCTLILLVCVLNLCDN